MALAVVIIISTRPGPWVNNDTVVVIIVKIPYAFIRATKIKNGIATRPRDNNGAGGRHYYKHAPENLN